MSTVSSENATITTAAVAAITTTVVPTTHSPKSGSDSTATMPDSACQLPVNMSIQSPATAAVVLTTPTNLTTITTAATTTTTAPRHNVSVTNIKCEMDELQTNSTQINGNIVPVIATHGLAYFNGSGIAVGTGLRIPVPKSEESDSETELTNIENLKVTRRVPSTNGSGMSVGDGAGMDTESNIHSKTGPRPMSWEGELSESEINETEQMDTEHSLSSNGAGAVSLAVIKSEATTTTPTTKPALIVDNLQYQMPHNNTPTTTTTFSTTPAQLQQSVKSKHSIKSELDQISVDMHNAGIYSSPHAKLKLAPTQSDPINLKYEPPDLPGGGGGVNSPLLARSKTTTLPLPANPSPDSAIHSVYTHSSPSQSPLTSRHAPYTPSLSRNNSDASHSSCYSYSSEFSPTHSPIQARHAPPSSAGNLYSNYNGTVSQNMLYRPLAVDGISGNASEAQNLSIETKVSPLFGNSSGVGDNGLPSSPAGISRQQLINSPCPICGDKISGFHYGIFSCESCKGFFKRTVQNRKNYVCIRGGPCPVSISTRKKCPACRFEKCLQKGMKLEAIREDRTRGGRSTYQCSYTLPNTILNPLLSPDQAIAQQQQQQHQSQQQQQQQQQPHVTQQQAHCLQQQQQQQRFGMPTLTTSSVPTHNLNGFVAINNVKTLPIKSEQPTEMAHATNGATLHNNAVQPRTPSVPTLLQEIMDVEHLWQYNEAELARLNQPIPSATTSSSSTSATSSNQMTNTLLVSCGLSSNTENANPDWIAHLCNVADHRLYKIVKWCKSLPLFKHISIDDQIRLLINSWCELLLFSCCFRSVYTPGEIKLSQGKSITLAQAKSSGLQACIERMLNLTDHLRRLRVDRYEYVAMKVIVLLQSDTSELQEPVKVRECQEKALQSLQEYTHAHYPDSPSKFGELLLRIPDLQRTYQLGKEMLTIKSRDGGGSDFNLLMELLRGEH